MRGGRRFVTTTLAALALAWPAARAVAQGDALHVVVSIHPWADLVSQVGGEAVAVTTLLPPGASPHAFEPLPSQAALLAAADLVVLNGGVDGWLERLVDATAPEVARLVVLDRVRFEPVAGHDDDHASEGGAGVPNPHVWLDPDVAAAAVGVIAEELAALRPDLDLYPLRGNIDTRLKKIETENVGVLIGEGGSLAVSFSAKTQDLAGLLLANGKELPPYLRFGVSLLGETIKIDIAASVTVEGGNIRVEPTAFGIMGLSVGVNVIPDVIIDELNSKLNSYVKDNIGNVTSIETKDKIMTVSGSLKSP